MSAHICHWPGCGAEVSPRLWGCRRHWFMLPKYLRDEIWRTFRPGQEIAKDPSKAYLAAARKVQDWIRETYPLSTRAAEGPADLGARVDALDAAVKAMKKRLGAGYGVK